MRIFASLFLLTACLIHKPPSPFICTLHAPLAHFEERPDGWGELYLTHVERLASFDKEGQRGKMRAEDFFTGWDLHPMGGRGKLTYKRGKQRGAIAIAVKEPDYAPQSDTLTLLIKPIEEGVVIPHHLKQVEVSFYVDRDAQPFWDKWMGL